MQNLPPIERVPATTKTWRTTRPLVIGATYRGQHIVARVPRGFVFQFSWPWGLRLIDGPLKRR